MRAALQDTDRRVGEGKPVAPSFLLACVLWSDVRTLWNQRMEGRTRQPVFPALQEAIDDVFSARIGDVSGGGRLAGDMREIWLMQPRFEKRLGSSAFGLVDQPRFRAAFDFMRLRADTGEVEEVLADWWQEFSLADDSLRQDMVDQVREEQSQRQRPARFTRAPTPRDLVPSEAAVLPGADLPVLPLQDAAPDLSTAADIPRKRRRRRRAGGPRETGGPDASSGDADA